MSEDKLDRNYYYNNVALIGTGLIGASITIALRERRLVESITGYDINPGILNEAFRRGAIDHAASSILEAVRDAELVILAVPVLSTAKLFDEVRSSIKPGTVVTDVGSSKGWIMKTVETLLPHSAYFIGGHPMAGSEESGIAGADPAMLENAIYVLTPGTGTPEPVIENLVALIKAAGAQPIIIDSEVHDRVVAAVSHLPHLAASALVHSVSNMEDVELIRTLAAGGFRDSTRIALGNSALWRDIFISNRDALLDVLQSYKTSIDLLEKYLAADDHLAIETFLDEARKYRKGIPHRGRGILPELHEAIVLVRDTPGVIGQLAGLLGEAGINIDAIEIMHVRELAGGSIRLGFRSPEHQQKAQELLNRKGYRTHCP